MVLPYAYYIHTCFEAIGVIKLIVDISPPLYTIYYL